MKLTKFLCTGVLQGFGKYKNSKTATAANAGAGKEAETPAEGAIVTTAYQRARGVAAGHGQLVTVDADLRPHMVDMVATLIVEAGLPFSFTDHPAFKEFCRKLSQQEHLDIPSRGTVTFYLSKLYRAFVAETSNAFHALMKPRYHIPGKVAMTTDCWTSDNKEGFIIITYHYVGERGLENFIAACEPLPYPHTSQRILETVVDVAERHGFNVIRGAEAEEVLDPWCICVTTDNASNMEGFINESGAFWLRNACGCHINQNCIKDHDKPAVVADPARHIQARAAGPLNQLFAPVRKLLNLFANSTKRRETLAASYRKLYPNKRLLRLVFPNDTRWDNIYIALCRYAVEFHALKDMPWDSLYDKRDAYDAHFAELARLNLDLPHLLELLAPFYDATTRLSSSSRVTISLIPRTVNLLLDATKPKAVYSPLVAAAAAGLHASLRKRWAHIINRDPKKARAVTLAQYLDPRTNHELYKPTLKQDGTKTDETDELINTIVDSIMEDRSPDAPDDDGITVSTTKSGVKRKQTSLSFKDLLYNEVADFFEDDAKLAVVDPLLDWWLKPTARSGLDENGEEIVKYPILAWCARSYLAAQASEAASERGASIGGRLYSARRQRMLASRANLSVVLHAASRANRPQLERRAASIRYQATDAIFVLTHPPNAAADDDKIDEDDEIVLDGVEAEQEVEADEGDLDNAMLDAGIAADENASIDLDAAVAMVLDTEQEGEKAGVDGAVDDDEGLADDDAVVEPEMPKAFKAPIAQIRKSARLAATGGKLARFVYEHE